MARVRPDAGPAVAGRNLRLSEVGFPAPEVFVEQISDAVFSPSVQRAVAMEVSAVSPARLCVQAEWARQRTA